MWFTCKIQVFVIGFRRQPSRRSKQRPAWSKKETYEHRTSRPIIRLKSTFKNPAAGKPLSEARICLNGQAQLKNRYRQQHPLPLSGWVLVPFIWYLNMSCYSLSRNTIRFFPLIRTEKAMSYLFIFVHPGPQAPNTSFSSHRYCHYPIWILCRKG